MMGVALHVAIRIVQGLNVWLGVLLQVRSHVEKQMDLIAKGQAEREAVVAHTLDQFARKFRYFVAKIERMDALFEASFSPLASSGESPSCWTRPTEERAVRQLHPYVIHHTMKKAEVLPAGMRRSRSMEPHGGRLQ